MGKLDGQVELITVASSGIVKATALEFGREGASVFVVYHSDDDEAAAVKAEIDAAGARCAVHKGDVGSEADVKMAFEACGKALGPATILMNNAGIDAAGINVADMTLDRWNQAISTNLTGPFLCSRAFVRARPAGSSGGKNTNVTAGNQGMPHTDAARDVADKGR